MTAQYQDHPTMPAPRILGELPHDEYLRHPALSSSGARDLLPPSCPARFKWKRDHPDTTSTADFDLGHATHKLALGAGAEIVQVDADSWRTNAAREQRDEAWAAGRTPLLIKDYELAVKLASALAVDPVGNQLLTSDGQSEVSLFWHDQDTGVERRARLDRVTRVGGQLAGVDVKTAVSADPGEFAKAAVRYGYHQQAEWYRDALTACYGEPDPVFLLLVVEKDPPHLVAPYEPDVRALQIGAALNRRAIDLYATCLKTKTWPGYTRGVKPLSLPAWYETLYGEIA